MCCFRYLSGAAEWAGFEPMMRCARCLEAGPSGTPQLLCGQWMEEHSTYMSMDMFLRQTAANPDVVDCLLVDYPTKVGTDGIELYWVRLERRIYESVAGRPTLACVEIVSDLLNCNF